MEWLWESRAFARRCAFTAPHRNIYNSWLWDGYERRPQRPLGAGSQRHDNPPWYDGKKGSKKSGCGAAWLARLLGVQEVPGSNPGGPTKFLKDVTDSNPPQTCGLESNWSPKLDAGRSPSAS